MSGFIIPYSDLLIRLALYQKDTPTRVLFSFQTSQGQDGEGQRRVLVQPADQFAGETIPFFNFPDTDPLRLWLSFGLITLEAGSLEKGAGTFSLTPKTFDLEILRSI